MQLLTSTLYLNWLIEIDWDQKPLLPFSFILNTQLLTPQNPEELPDWLDLIRNEVHPVDPPLFVGVGDGAVPRQSVALEDHQSVAAVHVGTLDLAGGVAPEQIPVRERSVWRLSFKFTFCVCGSNGSKINSTELILIESLIFLVIFCLILKSSRDS